MRVLSILTVLLTSSCGGEEGQKQSHAVTDVGTGDIGAATGVDGATGGVTAATGVYAATGGVIAATGIEGATRATEKDRYIADPPDSKPYCEELTPAIMGDLQAITTANNAALSAAIAASNLSIVTLPFLPLFEGQEEKFCRLDEAWPEDVPCPPTIPDSSEGLQTEVEYTFAGTTGAISFIVEAPESCAPKPITFVTGPDGLVHRLTAVQYNVAGGMRVVACGCYPAPGICAAPRQSFRRSYRLLEGLHFGGAIRVDYIGKEATWRSAGRCPPPS